MEKHKWDTRVVVLTTGHQFPILHDKLMFNDKGHCATGSANASRGGVEGENIEMLITTNSFEVLQFYFSYVLLVSSWLHAVRQRAIIDGSGNVVDGTLVQSAHPALLLEIENRWLENQNVQENMLVVAQSVAVVSFTPVFPTSRNLHSGKLERDNRNSTFCQSLLDGLNKGDTIFIVAMIVDLWFYALLKVCEARGVYVVVVGSILMSQESHHVLQSEQQFLQYPNMVSIIWDGGLLHTKFLVIARRNAALHVPTLEAYAGSANFTFAAMNKNFGEHLQRLQGVQDPQALLHLTLLLLKQIYPDVVNFLVEKKKAKRARH